MSSPAVAYNSQATTPARKVFDLPQPPPLGTLIPKSPYLPHLYPEGAPKVWESEEGAKSSQGSGTHVPRSVNDLVPLVTVDGTQFFGTQEASRVRYTFFCSGLVNFVLESDLSPCALAPIRPRTFRSRYRPRRR